MTTTSVAGPPSSSNPSFTTGPLRLFTQLRAYTHNHLSGHSPNGHHRPNRNSFSWVVGRGSHSPPDGPAEPSSSSSPISPLEPTISTQSAPEQFVSRQDRSRTVSAGGQATASNEPEMVRNRAATTGGSTPLVSVPNNGNTTTADERLPDTPRSNSNPSRGRPTVRLIAYQDPLHAGRPSLNFPTMTRTLPHDNSIIKVGRYSDRDGPPIATPLQPSEAPVGFRSKVVSRKHCEFSFINNQWHIKDIGSSSGTFLNNVRLSPPSMPSRLYPIRDGDIIQLGVDFKGGEEEIFRCVRIRLECNRAWQQQPNEFNKNTAQLINNLGRGSKAEFQGCRECSICLGSVLRPYQTLFMAACAHVWHYKCIRRLLEGPDPMFQCPNCRAYTDLNAEPDDSPDVEDTATATPEKSNNSSVQVGHGSSNDEPGQPEETPASGNANMSAIESENAADNELAARTDNLNIQEDSINSGERTPNIDIPNAGRIQLNRSAGSSNLRATANGSLEDCPLTPQNDLGPLALDGRAGRP